MYLPILYPCNPNHVPSCSQSSSLFLRQVDCLVSTHLAQNPASSQSSSPSCSSPQMGSRIQSSKNPDSMTFSAHRAAVSFHAIAQRPSVDPSRASDSDRSMVGREWPGSTDAKPAREIHALLNFSLATTSRKRSARPSLARPTRSLPSTDSISASSLSLSDTFICAKPSLRSNS